MLDERGSLTPGGQCNQARCEERFRCAKFFLPMTYLGHLAAMMQANGKARHDRKIPGYANWTVTVDDVLQWIGVWMYILVPAARWPRVLLPGA